MRIVWTGLTRLAAIAACAYSAASRLRSRLSSYLGGLSPRDYADLALLGLFLALILWTFTGCTTPKPIRIAQDCMTCGYVPDPDAGDIHRGGVAGLRNQF